MRLNPAARRFVRGIAAALILCAAGCGRGTAPARGQITVSAAISLKDALDQIGREFQAQHPNTEIAFNYGGSGTLQHQIEQGAPVDVFVSAAAKQMDALESEGLIATGTRRNVAANALVLIVPAGSRGVHAFADLARREVKTIALGEPATVPAGAYAREALDHLGLLHKIAGKIVYAKDVRQVLTFVETGNADAGFVYATDARISRKVRVAAEAPADSHDVIVYPAAMLKGAKHAGLDREFLDFLGGPEGRAAFAKFGFTAPEK